MTLRIYFLLFVIFQAVCLGILYLMHLQGVDATSNLEMTLFGAAFLVVSIGYFIWLHFQLEARQAAITHSEHQTREMFEANPNALLLCDPTGNILMVNRETEELFGYAREDLIGRPVETLVPRDKRDKHNDYVRGYSADPEKRNMGEGWDLRGLHSSGDEFPVSVGLTPISLPEGRGILAAVIDISQRVAAEEEIKRSNRELEQFAYVASHDLKAPLRGVQQLTGWITETLGDYEDEDLQRYLELLNSRVGRMELLLNSLLDYSRAGRREDKLIEVNTSEMVRSIAESLIPLEGWALKLDQSLPVFVTQNSALSQVFHNLIGNAVKHHDRPEGEITVTARDGGAFYEYRVGDDGPGIPAEFHGRVFEMFQTLQPRDEVEGSGMGLSLVKKLIEQQGGRIYLQSDPARERGTRFVFTWPKEVECQPNP